MQGEIWQRLLSLESRDVVSSWHKQIRGRELSARRAKEITSSAKQAREFFRNSHQSNDSVKPLLSFYGVTSLGRSALLLLKRGSGEEAIVPGHGFETVGWLNTLSGDISGGLSALGNLKIRTRSGLFTDFVRETDNCMCMHVNSAAVDWRIPYDVPPLAEEFTLEDLISRIPDLQSEHQRSSQAIGYASVNSMSYTEDKGFNAKIFFKQFEMFKDSYIGAGLSIARDGDWFNLSCDAATFNRCTPQFMHTYVNKMFGSIPALHLVKPFANGSRYSQMAITYMISYCLGMLCRYFPTHWISLLNGEKGDALWPAINSAQKYIDASFPELIVEFIHDTLDQARKAVAENPNGGSADAPNTTPEADG
ncbi:MAG TPA: YaaC family protein [Thermoanaerobaculia bacterium]|nr:YaaC family protein [Thermoanaerobaculia bacterium]